MYKVFRSQNLNLRMMIGIVESEGLKLARGFGIATTIEGIDSVCY